MCASFFELDRVRFGAYQRQCATLTTNYCGSITSARCSNAGDKLRILEEVGSLTNQVDATIGNMMQAGMSNPTLRKAALHQIDLKWVGYVPKGVLFLFVSFGFLQSLGYKLPRAWDAITNLDFRFELEGRCHMHLHAHVFTLMPLWSSAHSRQTRHKDEPI